MHGAKPDPVLAALVSCRCNTVPALVRVVDVNERQRRDRPTGMEGAGEQVA